MIHAQEGSIFKTDADAIVNPVNCSGRAMNILSHWFNEKYHENFVSYLEAYRNGKIRIGSMFVFETNSNPKYIINFPNKTHYSFLCNMNEIKMGVSNLRKTVLKNNISTIAIPSTIGENLDRGDVYGIIVDEFDSHDGINVLLLDFPEN